MAIQTTQWVYLGIKAEMDTDETNNTNENDAVPVGSYGVADMEIATVSIDDTSLNGSSASDGFIPDDEFASSFPSSDPITYSTSGGGVTTTALDSTSAYSAVVTLADGTTLNLDLYVLQTTDGGLFVSHNTALDGVVISNIEILGLANPNADNYLGFGSVPAGSDFDFGLDHSSIACFASQTQIETNRGLVAIDDLAVGDMVRTADHGLQPIRWIGSTTVAAIGENAPILISKGALGNERDLLVSPFHRMLVSDWRVEVLMGAPEVLTPAVHLCNDKTIRRKQGGRITYFHMMFDQHEVIFAEGAASESFHPSQDGIGNLAEESRAEIFRLFPTLADEPASYGPVARPCMDAPEAALLLGH